jgi:hypothetical protein
VCIRLFRFSSAAAAHVAERLRGHESTRTQRAVWLRSPRPSSQALLGHCDVRTAMLDTHGLNRGGREATVPSPASERDGVYGSVRG